MKYDIDWWIPVSERVPATDELELITILDKHGDTPYRYVTCGWYLKEADCWIVDNETRHDIIAWACLPSPYRYTDTIPLCAR